MESHTLSHPKFLKPCPSPLSQVHPTATLGYHDALLGKVELGRSKSEGLEVTAVHPRLPLPVRTVKLLALSAEPDDLVRQSLNKIRLMLESDLAATKLGKVLYTLAEDLNNEDKIRRTLRDTFARKAPATLYKRTNSLWNYFVRAGSGNYKAALHFTEEKVYEHVCHLKESAGSTSPSQFLEALNFFHELWGFLLTPAKELISPRVQGACHSAFVSKRPRMQARPLTAKEATALERTLLVSNDEYTIAVTGFLLFCLVNCARWSDAQAATEVSLDASGSRAVLESGTFRRKTARSSQQQSTLLPYVGFCQLLQDKEWGSKWISTIEDIHKRMPNLPALLPAWSEQLGAWLPRKMCSGNKHFDCTCHL